MSGKATQTEEDSRVSEILSRLKLTYPTARVALQYKTPWELLVAVMLSAQCTDIKVNEVTAKLFMKYPTLQAYVDADSSEFETDIHATGFYRAKAKNVLATAKKVATLYRGVVPNTMEELLTLPGVARKTANVVLGNAYGVVVGIAVDTHMIRLSQRLRLIDTTLIGGKIRQTFEKNGRTTLDFIKDADPVKIERALMSRLPKSEWFATTYRLIDHGRAICKAQNPKCSVCMLSSLCPASRVS